MASFQFKQFNVLQDRTAMKVGTDGALLGAWTNTPEGNALDIGTGTGLIALMMAQRQPNLKIDAIEIDEAAFKQANQNVKASNWSQQISIHHTPLKYFNPAKAYDVIACNPPFFTHGTKAPDATRNNARHTDELSFAALIDSIVRLLNPSGIFSLILPTLEAKQFKILAQDKGLNLNRRCVVHPNPHKNPKRVLMEFSKIKHPFQEQELTIETETRHKYTKEYISLTKDFYLNL